VSFDFFENPVKHRDSKMRHAQDSYYKTHLQKHTEALTFKNNHHIWFPNMGF